MTKKWVSGLGSGAATGAGIGGTVGGGIGTLILPGVGTAVGGAIGAGVGAVGGGIAGIISGLNAEDEDDEARHRAVEDAQKQANRSRTDAYNRFMLGEAARMGANPTLLAKAQYASGLSDIDYNKNRQIQRINDSADDSFDPQDLVPLAQAGAMVSNRIYDAGKYTPPPDIGMSPEAQKQVWEDNGETLKPLRKGVRMGFQ